MTETDREAVIETLMDVSGAKDAVNMGLDLLSSFNFTGLGGELFEVTSRLDKAFKQLERSFNKKQKQDIEENGFSFLEADQIRQLMKQHGYFFDIR
ncbi:unnamed protein product [Toxocara canis]|uniref:Site-specific DNA-methyltransferase (adenine-specific) n=1 Tax=Toxocara canis TaxID=6265 RepID=A0A183U2S6_TOXCA|nr:unnamed protein product [Toxocara canis]